MVDARRLLAILDRVSRDLQVLERLAGADLGDEAVLDQAKYRLVTAIEGLLQAGQHVIASERYPPPETYADVFRILGDQGVVPKDLAATGQDIARFRNLLVHGYAAVDGDRVADVVRSRGEDLRTLAAHLARAPADEE